MANVEYRIVVSVPLPLIKIEVKVPLPLIKIEVKVPGVQGPPGDGGIIWKTAQW